MLPGRLKTCPTIFDAPKRGWNRLDVNLSQLQSDRTENSGSNYSTWNRPRMNRGNPRDREFRGFVSRTDWKFVVYKHWRTIDLPSLSRRELVSTHLD